MSGPCTDCGGPDYRTLVARISELDAELKAWRKMIVQMDRLRLEQVERAKQAEAALAERDRMLRLSARETAPYDKFTGSTSEKMYQGWIADIRARAEEGGGK